MYSEQAPVDAEEPVELFWRAALEALLEFDDELIEYGFTGMANDEVVNIDTNNDGTRFVDTFV